MIISEHEIAAIATLSAITIKKEEFVPLCDQVIQILQYAEMVKDAAQNSQTGCIDMRKSNTFRDDLAIQSDTTALLNASPSHDGSYFVVPLILETSR